MEAIIIGIVKSAIRLATPYLYASIGETIGQLSGVLNLGVDGVMLMGAFSAFYTVLKTGNLWLGLLAAIVVGAIFGLLIAFINVTLKAEQGISGIGVYIFGLGLSSLLFSTMVGTVQNADGIFMNLKNIARESERLISNFDIRTPSRHTSLKSLSGGNIQKLILARELSRKPGVLIASQPTRGLDVSATEYVHRQLIGQRRKLKTATLLISDDLDEILSLSDRIAVIYEGKIMGVVKRNEVSIGELGMMMGGVKKIKFE